MMTTRDYMRVLRGGWIIILASALFSGVGAIVVSGMKEPVYVATSTLAVSTCVAVGDSPVCDPVGGMNFAIQRASIYEKTGTSLPVIRRALELTDAVSKRSTLQEHTSVVHTADSPMIDVTASWHDPDGAAEIANAMSAAIVEYARGSVDSFESEMTTVDFSVISEAAPPSEPVDDTVKTVALAIMLGLLVGLLLALARYHSDKRVKDREEVERESGVAVLATISRGPLTQATPVGVPSEAFRRLSATTTIRLAEGNFHTLLVASPDDGEASGEVARGLATALAETGVRVAVVDLGSHRVNNPLSATDETLPENSFVDVTATVTPHQLSAGSDVVHIPVGTLTSNPATTLNSTWLAEVSAEISDTADILIVNAAPVLKSADSLSVVRLADGVVLVVDLGRTQLDDLRESVRALELVGSKPLGIAMLS